MKTLGLVCSCFVVMVSVLGVDADPSDEQVEGGLATPAHDRPNESGRTNAGLARVGHPTFVSPQANPIAVWGDRVFVVNTPADTVDVIDAGTHRLIHRVPVGVDPVSIAVRPDGLEVWVSNHVSDSVSVIDNDDQSPTFLTVVGTIQSFDADRRATTFDEPVGIAFANNHKAYVALSSENQIVVVDVDTHKIARRLSIPAQDPRAIHVRNGKLYVLPFESNNKTQLSGGKKKDIDGRLVTFDAWDHSIFHNNVLSIGHVLDIVKHPDVPDHDLFVFDTETDQLLETVDSLGTLLYGLAVASDGTLFVAQTDARNDVNGRAGTKKHDLSQLENRPFLNQITRLAASDAGVEERRQFFDLEPLPPSHPEPGNALATPFAIQISNDDTTLVATAAGSDKLFTVDASSGAILGRVDVGAVPRGVALQHHNGGQLESAWVLNAVANTVSLVDLADRNVPNVITTVTLSDPTNPVVKRGRMAFESAAASSTETFSCASCHPDGHTDQLLWVLKTPVVTGGDQIMPRSTMPVRGLRDTEPYHWDGIPGDPYGGNNSAHVYGNEPPNAVAGDSVNSVRHLIDGGLASTMLLADDPFRNDEQKAGHLSGAERDAMARFLLSVPYPPAQRRPYNSQVTERAREGFRLFHIDGDDDPTKPKPNICGDCHRMPHLVSTNTPGTGMDAPTWRGAYDRFLILPQGRLNILDFDFYAKIAEKGIPEREMWQFSWAGRERFDPVWDMVLEMSTGYSGAFARQVTLDEESAKNPQTLDLLTALEDAATEGAIVLEADSVWRDGDSPARIHLQFGADRRYYPTGRHDHGGSELGPGSKQGSDSRAESGLDKENDDAPLSRADLLDDVSAGKLIVTLTGRHGERCDVDDPQPVIWTLGPIEKQRGQQEFPVLYPGETEMIVSGRHVDHEARVYIDGHRVDGRVTLHDDERIAIDLGRRPDNGMHLLQLQNPNGQFSNDFIALVADKRGPETDEPEKPKNLAHALERSGWSRMIGVWGDAESNGKGLKWIFKWKIPDRVIEVESIDAQRTSVSLISVNAKNGDVFQIGADSTGASHLGTWTFEKEKKVVVRLGYTDGDGAQGQLVLRYHLIDDDRLDFTLGLPQPVHIRMVRISD